ncbi:MAG: hypothetical protein PUE85_01960 [Firmicutes bacterium]|nr:hypothetical protein [Bacillota bacterium]
MRIIVRNLRLSPSYSAQELETAVKKRLFAAAGRDVSSISLYKRSVDARRRDRISLICSASAEIPDGTDPKKLAECDASVLETKCPTDGLILGNEPLQAPPVIVGFGPCGMFCALMLAENGYAPVVVERGGSVKERRASVEKFYADGKLDPESNIQFGAGGAGTFSDGKLVTRINDPAVRFVLEKFYEFGAPEDILTNAKPHVGTDVLYGIVEKLAARIESLGGKILYNTRVDDILIKNGSAVGIATNRGDIPCGALVLCTGHSARDTFGMLGARGIALVPKPFSVGVRIEHLQCDIDEAMYGRFAGMESLGHAEYQLSHRLGDGTGVYTFCMCPGGEVVAAASEEGGVVVNGMSRHARDGKNSNSAVAVSVSCELAESFGGGIAFQRRLERAAYESGTGGAKAYSAPCQTLGDFLNGKSGSLPGRILPTYMGGNVNMTDIGKIFPAYITGALKEGISAMDGKLGTRGVFAAKDAVLTGVETRTSSPLRIPRLENMTADGFDNIYPAGEGAGYAGGITSAASDGIACALAIMRRFRSKSR